VDLVLHVGLMKTGTTTLQKHVFPQVPGYVGRLPEYPFDNRDAGLGREYVRFLEGGPVDISRWRDEVLRAPWDADVSSIVVSRETLTRWTNMGSWHVPMTGRLGDYGRPSRRSPHPLLNFLRQEVIPAWDVGRVRIIVTLRNQTDMLASLYAQMSNRILSASQRDFEHQVNLILSTKDAYLDFAELIEGLQRTVEDDAVTVLLLEEMGTSVYREDLAIALGVEPDTLTGLDVVMNRRGQQDVWELRGFRPEHLRQALIGREPFPGSPRRWTSRAVIHPVHSTMTATRRREPMIHVTDSLRERVRAACSVSNARLAGIVRRELIELGY
jgi:hypothetical protein